MRRALSILVLVVAAIANAADKRPMTPEDLWKVKRVGPPTISPGGKWCAVEVTTWNIQSNDSASQIWLLSTDGKTQKQLTNTAGKNSDPKWSPDGKWIAFISKRNRDETPQIYLITLAGGEARRVSNMPFAPSALKWSGDSSKIYFIAWTWPDTPDDAGHKRREKEKAATKSKARIIDGGMYRYWDKWLTDGKKPYVFEVDLKNGSHRNLMAGTGHSLPLMDPSEMHYDVAPDGEEVCYVHNNVKDAGIDVNLDLFTLRLDQKNAKPKCITKDNKGNDWHPAYMPDFVDPFSKKPRKSLAIAFLRQRAIQIGADQALLRWYDRVEDRVLQGPEDEFGRLIYGLEPLVPINRCLIGALLFGRGTDLPFERSVVGKWLAKHPDSQIEPEVVELIFHGLDPIFPFNRSILSLRWYSDGLAPCGWWLEVEDKGFTRQFILGGRGAGMLMRFADRGSIRSVECAAGAKDAFMFTWSLSSFDQPPIVGAFGSEDRMPYLSDEQEKEQIKRDGFVTAKLTSRPIDHFNDDLVAQWKLGKVENRTFKGAGGQDVQMWVVYPPDFDPAKKWPLVHLVHDGPHEAFNNDFNFRWNPHVWAARGWIVAMVNFHGSAGFGQDFADSIAGDLATKSVEDIMKATDWFEQQSWIDKNRIAAAGEGLGGYMMAWLNGHTDRFKAMVCHAGIYDVHGMMAADGGLSREFSLLATSGDLEKIDRQSPHRFAANFKTPTLISHGEQDFCVPVTQGLEYYNTLRQKRVTTRLIYFPDEGHWILKPQNSLLWHKEVFAWLEKYVGRGPSQ